MDGESREGSNSCVPSDLGIGRREAIEEQLRNIVENINNSRKRNVESMEMLKQELKTEAEAVFSSVENRLYQVYEAQGPHINSKMQELNAMLGRIAALEEELWDFKQSLGIMYKDTASANKDGLA